MPNRFDLPARPRPAPDGVVDWLEPRRLLASVPLAASGLPLLHSLPGARVAIFLDFDGFGSTYAPFDTDRFPATFEAPERADIELAWRHLSSYFSMFNVDVTTEQPEAGTPFSYSIVSNSVLTGAYNFGSFPDPRPINFHSPGDARFRQTVLAHEAGHSFGLLHQSEYDGRGNRTQEYFGGYDRLHGALMGVDYAREVHKWFIGHPHTSPAVLQDDVATIAGRVRAFAGGDGFRADDVPGALEGAAGLAFDTQGRAAASGIIERLSDADAFRFELAAGRAVRVDVTPPVPSMLDAKVEVYASDGSLIAAADGTENHQHLALPWLAAGTYYAVVKSHGNYADLGPYDLSIHATPGVTPETPDGDPPARLRVDLTQGMEVSVAWEPAAEATGYAIQRSEDGGAWQTIATIDAPQSSFADAPALGGHRYFYRVTSIGPSGPSAPSDVAHVVTRPAAVSDLSLTTWQSGFVLNWRDTSGESGYRVYRRSEPRDDEPGPWVLLGETGPNIPSFADESLTAAARYRYRVSADGAEAAAEVTGTTPFHLVPGMRAAVVPGTGTVRLDWDPIDYPTNYRVERGTTPTNFARLADVTTTTFFDTSADPATVYHYRVIGTNDADYSAPSAIVTTFTPGTPLPAGWTFSAVTSDVPPPGAAAHAGDQNFRTVGSGLGLVTDQGRGFTADSFRFLHRTLTGDGSIVARIVPGESPPGATAGIMFRAGTGAADNYFFAGVSRRHGRGYVTRGSSINGFTRTGEAAPTTLRVDRTGNTIEFYELSGQTWIRRATVVVMMGTSVQAGLVCASGSEVGVASAQFQNVDVSNAPPPVILTLPAAQPATVTGEYTNLSVLASDPQNEATLVYRWTVDSQPGGVRPPVLSLNDHNVARSTTALFFGVGRYVFRVTVTNQANTSASSTVIVDVVPNPSDVFITPAAATIRAGGALDFAATPIDQFGAVIVGTPERPAPSATWVVSSGEVVETGDYSMRYTAPAFAGWDQISANVGGFWASMALFVYDELTPAVVSAVSRKVHGMKGVVDLPLAIYGAPAVVEPRRGGPTTLVFTFSGHVSPADGSLGANDFSLTNATFRSARLDGRVLTLELGGVSDGATVYAGIIGLLSADGNGLSCDTDVEILPLSGDADRDGRVSPADALAARSRAGRPGGRPDLLYDLDLDGVVSAADQVFIRRRIANAAVAPAESILAPHVTAPASVPTAATPRVVSQRRGEYGPAGVIRLGAS